MRSILIIILLMLGLSLQTEAQQQMQQLRRDSISIRGKDIYYNTNMIGYYLRPFIDSELMNVVIYNRAKNRVAEITHSSNDSVWTIITPVDQEKQHCAYREKGGLIDVIYYLLIKQYL